MDIPRETLLSESRRIYGPNAPVLTEFMDIDELDKVDIAFLHLKQEDWRPPASFPKPTDAAWSLIPEIMQRKFTQASMEQQVRFANIYNCLYLYCFILPCSVTPESKDGARLTSQFSLSLDDILSACIFLISIPDGESSSSSESWNEPGLLAMYLWEMQAFVPSLTTQLFSYPEKIVPFALAAWIKLDSKGDPYIHTHSTGTTGWGCPTAQLLLECLKSDDCRKRIFDILLHHPNAHTYRSAVIESAVLRCILSGTKRGEGWMFYVSDGSGFDGACTYLSDVLAIVERLSALPCMSLQILQSPFFEEMHKALFHWIFSVDKEIDMPEDDGELRRAGEILTRLLTWIEDQEKFGPEHCEEIDRNYSRTVTIRALIRLLPQFLFEVPVAWEDEVYIANVESCVQKLRQRYMLAHAPARRELWESVMNIPTRYTVGQPQESSRHSAKHRAAWFQFVKQVLELGTELSLGSA